MPPTVRELDAAARGRWDEYVRAHPEATFFHTPVWQDAVEAAFGHASCALGAWRGERLAGVFPLFRVESRLAGRILVSTPYAVYGGTLADDAACHRALLEAALERARDMRARWVDIRSETARWGDLPVVTRYVTFRRRLPGDPAEVLARLPRKARAAARHARERFGLQVVFGDEHLPAVWELYSRSMRRLGSLNYPPGFFEALVRSTPAGSADPEAPGHRVQLVLHRDRPVAGVLSFTFRGVMMPYFSGCDERFEKYHPNHLMYLAAMEEAVRMGCRVFDFGRSRADNTGACDFKRFQGFQPRPLEYQYAPLRGTEAPDLHPDNPRLAVARRLWPRLPLAVTRPLGAWLARSIPG